MFIHNLILGAVVAVIVWYLDLQLHMQSVPITTKVVSLKPIHGEVYSIQHYMIKFVSNLQQVGGFLWVLRFPPPKNWPPRYNWNIVESGVKYHKPTHFYYNISEVQIDESTVQQLAEMGFNIEGCKRAVYNTNNSGVEAAMNWVMEHMEDAGNDLLYCMIFVETPPPIIGIPSYKATHISNTLIL